MSTTSSIHALLTSTLLLAGSAAFAQTAPDSAPLTVGVYATGQVGKICLSVVKQPNTVAWVHLLAPTGETLYQAQLPKKESSLRQILDLQDLKDGTYRLHIRQGETVIVKSIQLQTNTPEPALAMRHLTLSE